MSASSSPYRFCKIPSVNLTPFFTKKGVVIGDAPTEDQLRVAATINRVCQEHGFVHVTNFGMSNEMGEKLFAASRELFDNPKKGNDYEPWSPATNTGFSAFRNESLNRNRPPDLKEAFNIRLPPAWENPSIPMTPQSFQDIIDDYLRVMKTATIRYGMVCSLALDLPMDTFTKVLNTFDMCTARFLHYPPCHFVEAIDPSVEREEEEKKTKIPTASAKVQLAIRVGEHTDFGTYTFLLLASNQGPMGLQIKPGERGGEIGGSAGGEEGGWMDVVIEQNSDGDSNVFGAIINTGAMLARMTNDFWRATPHRVIVPTAEIAAKDRYSIAFFVDPDSHEMIKVEGKYKDYSSPEDGKAPLVYREPISSKDFILMKLNELAQAGRKE